MFGGFEAARYSIAIADGGFLHKATAYLEGQYAASYQFSHEANAIDQFEAIKVAMAGMVLDFGDKVENTASFQDLLSHMPDRELRDDEGYLRVFPTRENHVEDTMAAEQQRDTNSGVEELDHGS